METQVRVISDLGNLIGKSQSVRGVSSQQRTPIVTHTRIRGQRVGQVLAAGSLQEFESDNFALGDIRAYRVLRNRALLTCGVENFTNTFDREQFYWVKIGSSMELACWRFRNRRCVARTKSFSSASKMLGTYFCGLRSMNGNQLLWT